MCHTQAISFGLAIGIFIVAAYEYKTFRNVQYSIGLAYFGLMEFLQGVQHSWLAVPEDNYAMCANPTNQFLTFLGGLHVCFQPLFCNMALTAFFRRSDFRDRIEGNLVQKLCLLSALWMLSTYIWAITWPDDPNMAPPATEACPNYEWLREGYDGYLQETTPNIPGHSCTYQSPSEEGHLAWVLPMHQATYFFPNVSTLHAFCMFAPYLLISRRPLLQVLVVALWITGPLSSSYDTPSVNEQASIWCFYSVFQAFACAFIYRYLGVHKNNNDKDAVPNQIVIPGSYGEEPLVYERVQTKSEKQQRKMALSP